MFRLSAQLIGDTLDVYLFDDHAESHGGDHNVVSAWEDLLEGATTVTVQFAPLKIVVEPDPIPPDYVPPPPEPATAYSTFVVDLGRYEDNPRRTLRAALNAAARDKAWCLRYSIDGGPWLGPIAFRW